MLQFINKQQQQQQRSSAEQVSFSNATKQKMYPDSLDEAKEASDQTECNAKIQLNAMLQ